MKERLGKFRSFRLFMDICVRCGACADKCHFYLGSADPKNMPVMRAELMRSVYRRYFTLTGRFFGALAGGRETDRRRHQGVVLLLLPVHGVPPLFGLLPVWHRHRRNHHDGPRTAEPDRLQHQLGCSSRRPTASAPATISAFSRTDSRTAWSLRPTKLEEITGIRVEVPINRKGAEILFVMPSADYFGTPHYYTLLGYLSLFHEIGLDYTFSAYASEGGNFGLFSSHEMMKRLNAKIYDEARRLGVKWILGGECGHMWRVLHQYMDTMNGPADFLEVPVSPITGTRFENARSTRMVHICEFTADLIHHGKLKLDRSRNDHWNVTYHDSCNPARGMGLLEEPRYILKQRLQPFSRDAGEHHPRADLLLRQRRGPGHG